MKQADLELTDNEQFVEKLRKKYKPDEAEKICSAYAFARRSLPNASDIFSVAGMLLNQGADSLAVMAALLAPVFWERSVDLDEIGKSFGREIVSLLKEIKSLNDGRNGEEAICRRDIHAFLNTLAQKPQRAVPLLALRLIELEKALGSNEKKCRRKARETLDLYVPVANHLTLGELRRRLEDVCFRILDGAAYEKLKSEVGVIQKEDDQCLEILADSVRSLLDKNGIAGKIDGRCKSLYGIHRKMTRLGKPLQEIMDRLGMRIIVRSVPECYSILGILHSHFKPIPGTFDDYIGLPKENGYQSLHTCVYPVREVSHKPIEFQIRTEMMHTEAEQGMAAHWRYKNPQMTEKSIRQSQWMQSLVERHKESDSADAFIKLLHQSVYEDHVVVFGRAGLIVRLPDNATVEDFIQKTNIPVTNWAILKVNGEVVDRDRILSDGDSVEIINDSQEGYKYVGRGKDLNPHAAFNEGGSLNASEPFMRL